MLLTALHILTIAPLVGPASLSQQIEECFVFTEAICMEIKFEVYEEVLVLDVLPAEDAHIAALFLIDLHVAEVTHDSLV